MTMLIGMVSAYDLTFHIRDLNTKKNIANASVTYYNNNTYYNKTTDNEGFVYNNDGFNGVMFYNVSKSGYFPLHNAYINISENTYLPYFMTPISDTGLIKIKFMDDNPIKHKLCLFYENMRIENSNCYAENDTMQLINNKNYYVIPSTGFTDNFNTLSTIYEYLNRLSSWFIGLFILFAIIMLLIRK
jgi:hypothetical protein